MQYLKITPYDTLFFRDGKPFTKNMSNRISSMFVPNPSTFHGAIFTALLAQNDTFREVFMNLGQAKKKEVHNRVLEIGTVYLYEEKHDAIYMESPKDLFWNSRIVKKGVFKSLDTLSTSLKTKYYLETPDILDGERCDDTYVNLYNFYYRYSNDFIRESSIKKMSDIFTSEFFTRLEIDRNKKSAKEGHLFTIEQIGFDSSSCNRNWHFLVEFDVDTAYVSKNYNCDIVPLTKGQLKLGGEQKACELNLIDVSSIPSLEHFNKCYDELCSKEIHHNERIKVVFTSPAVFQEDPIATFNKTDFELLAVVSDKPRYIGGYDLASGQSRKMVRGYAAGTVLLLQYKGQNSNRHHEMLTDIITAGKTNGFNRFIYTVETNEGVR
ncbi:type III-B CRISPR module-associated Cmr3 family protein [Fusibacter sp. JL298sf-3]